MKTTRRSFVVTTGATVAGSFSGCGGGGSPSSPTAPPTPPSITGEIRIPLMAVGQTVTASANLVGGLQTPLAVTRVSDTEVVAVSRICTHEACTVNLPTSAGATLDCPCHGSRYRTTGQVVNGPATRALFQFPARIVGNEVVITP
ncbi:MAG TPA: Rieske (2Fe-2S) protein [Vicinamibacterales bacterium]